MLSSHFIRCRPEFAGNRGVPNEFRAATNGREPGWKARELIEPNGLAHEPDRSPIASSVCQICCSAILSSN